MRKASFQLSVNFLVVMIICIALLGIGIYLVRTFSDTAVEMKEEVDNYHKEQLIRALSQGALVSVFPQSQTVRRGDNADFYLAMSNELGQEEDFYISIISEDSGLTGIPLEPLFMRGPYLVENNEQRFVPLKIISDTGSSHGSYLFNLRVCYGNECSNNGEPYGSLQKIQVNVK